ncbi:MAG: hypothetical protein K2X82_26180 [Gemmataceae bacterium]|nr:hypothetical protein [Gemmataceae bacterium]
MGDRSTGTFLTKSVTRPAVGVDAAGWTGTSSGGWTSGEFVTRNATREPVSVDCSGWGAGTADAALELVVTFDAGTPPAAVFEHTKKLVEAAAAAVPDLGLTYDFARSRAEGDDVVVVLTPRRPTADARQRLREVAEVVRQATRVPVRVAA